MFSPGIRHRRGRAISTLTTLCVVAVLLVIPASGATVPSSIRLHLGADGRYFQYGTVRQDLLPAKSGCQITSSEPVVDLISSGATNSEPGLGADSLGVKYSKSSSNGTPCSQVDSVETLTLGHGSDSSLAGRRFTGVRLDLEMTGNALVKLRLVSATGDAPRFRDYYLQTGTTITAAQASEEGYNTVAPYQVTSGPGDETDACASPNSSGPNNAGNDNCQWNVAPNFTFDTMVLTTVQGTVSLEGGGDFPAGSDSDTLLFLDNSAPTANNDSYTTNEDTAKTDNVLTNDSDPEGNTLSVTANTQPSHGTVSVASDGAFTYTPTSNYSGSDSFGYTASDGTSTSSATVSITVTAVNDPPVATATSVSGTEDTKRSGIAVGTDVDSSSLTTSCTGAPTGSTVTDNGNGTIDYTPPANLNGAVSLSCTVSDGTTTTSSVTITVNVGAVNDAPIAVDDTDDVDQNDAARAVKNSVDVNVLGDDTDVDGDTLTLVAYAPGTATSTNGGALVGNADGTVTYTPVDGFVGDDTFTYQVSDGHTTDTGSVTVTVHPVICSSDKVPFEDGDVVGSFTRLSDNQDCKRYTLVADGDADSVLFQPSGGAPVSFRGLITIGSDTAPVNGGHTLLLNYDPDGGDDPHPVQWCTDTTFDDGVVTSATVPAGETWCIASADTYVNSDDDLVTTWQVYGVEDPKFTR